MQFSISPAGGNQCAYIVFALPERALRNKKIVVVHSFVQRDIRGTQTVDIVVLGRCILRHSGQIHRYRNTFLFHFTNQQLVKRKLERACRNISSQIVNLKKIRCRVGTWVVVNRRAAAGQRCSSAPTRIIQMPAVIQIRCGIAEQAARGVGQRQIHLCRAAFHVRRNDLQLDAPVLADLPDRLQILRHAGRDLVQHPQNGFLIGSYGGAHAGQSRCNRKDNLERFSRSVRPAALHFGDCLLHQCVARRDILIHAAVLLVKIHRPALLSSIRAAVPVRVSAVCVSRTVFPRSCAQSPLRCNPRSRINALPRGI